MSGTGKSEDSKMSGSQPILVQWVPPHITAPRAPKEKKTKGKTIHRKYICLTYSQCPATPEEMLEHFKTLWPETKIVYVLIGQEHHVEEGLHLHCYVELNYKMNVKNMNFFDYVKGESKYPAKVKEAFSKGNKPGEGKFGWFDYIRKEGFKIIEWGTPPIPAAVKKTKKEINEQMQKGTSEIVKLVDEGHISMKDLPRWVTGKLQYDRLKNKSRGWRDVEVKWYYGSTGKGKTRKAIDEATIAGKDYWISDGKTLDWFDDYDGEEYVILDEVRGDTTKWAHFLRLLDGHRLTVAVKGGFVAFVPLHIVITSFGPPEKVFVNHKTGETWDAIDQLLRRIDIIRNFDEQPYNPTPAASPEPTEEITPQRMEEEITEAQRIHDDNISVSNPIALRLPSLHESIDHMVEDSSLTDLELTPTWESDK